MQILQTLGVSFLLLLLFGIGFILGRRSGIKACSDYIKVISTGLGDVQKYLDTLKKAGEQNGEQGSSQINAKEN